MRHATTIRTEETAFSGMNEANDVPEGYVPLSQVGGRCRPRKSMTIRDCSRGGENRPLSFFRGGGSLLAFTEVTRARTASPGNLADGPLLAASAENANGGEEQRGEPRLRDPAPLPSRVRDGERAPAGRALLPR